MNHEHDHHHNHRAGHADGSISLNRLALSATIHCMIGCGIGEVLGMVIGTSLGWGNWSTVALSVGLAFLFGYSLALIPLFRSGLSAKTAFRLALASDTVSITVMEIVDNAVMLLVPGAMAAGLTTGLFWGAMIGSMILAGAAAFPVNRWLIARGRGHALVHEHHH